MTPFLILQDIIAIAGLIRKQINLFKKNQSQLLDLSEKIELIVGSLRGLSELPDTQQYKDSLIRFKTCLQEACEFIQRMRKTSQLQRALNARADSSKIAEFKQKIADLQSFLNTGLAAQQLMNAEQDRRNVEQDHQQLMVAMDQHFRALQAHLSPEIIARQVASILAKSSVRPEAAIESFLADELVVDFYDLTFSHKIHTSDTGDLYHGQWRHQSVTIKLVELVEDEAARQQFMQEISIMSRLHNEHIMPFYGACIERQRLCFLTGLMEQGHLGQVLTSLSFAERLRIAQELAQGLVYLHTQKVVHGGVKLENIGVNRYKQAKWMNVGLVKTQIMSLASHGIAQDVRWQAPESWQRNAQPTIASDMYSFGLVLWALMTQRLPYASLTSVQIMSRVTAGRREVLSSDMQAAELIQACWSMDATKRPSASGVLQSLNTMRPSSPTGEEYYQQGVEAQKIGDLAKARDYYERSSQKKYVKGVTSFGLFKLDGLGGEPMNKQAGIDYLLRAAQGSHQRAMYSLARTYEKGDTPSNTPDLSQALYWYRKALKQDPDDAHCKKKIDALTLILASSDVDYRFESKIKYK